MVESFPHDFVLASDGRPPADVVRAALAPRLRVTPDGRPRTLRLTWLDTFDWRLYRAGLMLRFEQARRGGGRLVLSRTDGTIKER